MVGGVKIQMTIHSSADKRLMKKQQIPPFRNIKGEEAVTKDLAKL